jgi:L-asparagine transporter-like permease
LTEVAFEDGGGLGRTLRSRHVEMIAIGGIIGAGLFVGSSTSIATVGPAVIVSYALAGLVIVLIMRMLSEMAMALPHAGSFTEFTRIALGNWAGFIGGWLYWYFWVVVVAIEAIAGAVIIQEWLPFETWQIGVVLLASMTAVNLMSTRSYGEFEFWFASLKVAAIVVFIVIAAAYASGITAPTGATFGNLTAHGGFAPFGVVAVLAGVTSVIFALCGAEIATIAAAESAEPARTIARMTLTVSLRILLFYVLSIALIVSIVPWREIVPGYSPFAAALEYMRVQGAATVMKVVVLVAVLSCLNSGLYVTARALFTLAAHGDAPRSLVKVNRRRVPVRAILIGSLFGYLALAASVLSPQIVFSFLVNASGATMLIIYLIVAVAQIRQRRLLEATAPERLAIRMWWFPYASYGAIAAIVAVLAAMAFTPGLASQLYCSVGVFGVAGLAFVATRR